MAIYNPEEVEKYHQTKVGELKREIKQVIEEYKRIASKNRKGDWEEGRYEGVKELGEAVLEVIK